MKQEEKLQRAFFAQKIANKLVWSDTDTERMLDFLDPVWPGMTPAEEAKHLSRRALDFTVEFKEWQARQPKSDEKLPPMSEAELEELAAIL